MQHLMSTVVIRGQKCGEIRKVPVKDINELLYSLMESAIFRMAVLGSENIEANRSIINFAIESIVTT